jgi:hypothetical protein
MPKQHRIPPSSIDQKARQTGTIDDPTKSAKPPPPVQIRAAPPIHSGGGSVPHEAIFEAFPHVWALASSGKLRIKTEPTPLADVEQAWQRRDLDGRRLVLVQ